MKKLAIVLAAVMVLAMTVPAMAADIDFSGSLEAGVSWEDGVVGGSNTAKMNLGIQAGENTHAVIEFGGFTGKEDFGGDFDESIEQLAINKAYIETTGALWNGGNDVTARLGDLDISYSPYVAKHAEDGVSVAGIQAGPALVDGFYSWNAGRDAQGMNAAASIEGINMKGTLVRVNDNYDWAVEGDAMVVDGVEVKAAYAANEANDADMYRVDSTVQAHENLKIMAGYRSVDEAFRPEFVEKTYEEDEPEIEENRNDWVATNRGQHGFSVGFQTTQAGIDLTAKYDDPTQKINLDAATEYEGVRLTGAVQMGREANMIELEETKLGAEKDFDVAGQIVTGTYNATLKPNEATEHELGAKATITAIPQLQNLEVEGSVALTGTEVTGYSASADYTAPNGLNLGVGYDKDEGASVDAGIKVEF